MSSTGSTPRTEVDLEAALRFVSCMAAHETIGWLVVGIPICGVMLAFDSSPSGLFSAGIVGLIVVLCVAGSVRTQLGRRAALRDFVRAATPPRRAYVAMIPSRNPYASKPLLAIWSDRPDTAGSRLPKPDRVYRADEDLNGLLSPVQSVQVHEAWVDTGARPNSTPRWVVTNDDLAVPHRRAFLGRHVFSWRARARSAVQPLVVEPARPGRGLDTNLPRFGLSAITTQLVVLGALAALLLWWPS